MPLSDPLRTAFKHKDEVFLEQVPRVQSSGSSSTYALHPDETEDKDEVLCFTKKPAHLSRETFLAALPTLALCCL